jgi:hypothetical protein
MSKERKITKKMIFLMLIGSSRQDFTRKIKEKEISKKR